MAEVGSIQVSTSHYPARGGAAQAAPANEATATATAALKGQLHDHFTPSIESVAILQKLQQRDQEVRSHEQAHIAAGGGNIQGAASYTYQKGPDGQLYAVGGEVNISTSAVSGDPQATMEKAATILRAALAPSSPSSQDMSVAASATRMIASARVELSQLHTEPGQAQLFNQQRGAERGISAYTGTNTGQAGITEEAVSLFV
ncbi:MAG: hypothetical protein HN842_08540 [Gammaproteobacteria bacterium]|jgi:hypothetical protein|nr:hypothetical protein [Gammaproteobacteria bacterium]MBT7308253.1 hypothetical protein [Gammaproteobacteria bacterium]